MLNGKEDANYFRRNIGFDTNGVGISWAISPHHHSFSGVSRVFA